MSEIGFFKAEWPAPERVKTAITLRHPGASHGPYSSFDLALHVGDNPAQVKRNRDYLAHSLGVGRWQWLEQVHSTDIVEATAETVPRADGAYTDRAGLACAVLTADCLPVLLCDSAGRQVAAVHAGWRGLTRGILSRAVQRFDEPAHHLMAYLGPAISQPHYEIDLPVIDELARLWRGTTWQSALEEVSSKPGHYRLDLYQLARVALTGMGVDAIYGGSHCTFSEADRFYSYRRDGVTGRFASVVWLEDRH